MIGESELEFETNSSQICKPCISVIVPIYKVEKYLSTCIDSLINQTFKDYEVILVDDGSPDQCGRICDEYSDKYSFIHAYHKNNGGLSDARNYGVKHSCGRYISFVDSDDFVTENYLQTLYTLIVKYDADVSCAQHKNVYDDYYAFHKYPYSSEIHKCVSPSVALINMCYGKQMSVCAYNKLFRRSLVEMFPFPTGKLHEDIATTYKLIGYSKKIVYSNQVQYFYRQRSGSIMHSKLDEAQLYGINAAEEQLLYIKKYYPSAERAARFKLCQKLMEYMSFILMGSESNKELFEKLRLNIEPYVSEVLQDSNVSRQFKIRLIAVKLGYSSMRRYWILSDVIKKTMNKIGH